MSRGPETKRTSAVLPSDFRDCMRHLAGAVTVVATGSVGARSGLTATAVCSLSDDPPTLLVCVNRLTGAHNVIQSLRHFSINLLAADQEVVAGKFAGRAGLKGEARFTGDNWRTLATGAPVLADALAAFDCEIVQEHLFPTHTIFIGLVVATAARDTADPLLYLRGRFRTLADD